MYEKKGKYAMAQENPKPYWQCQSCGHKDHKKPLPKDRDAYYRNPKPAKCPRCKSDDMAPVGF
jgi:Zn ribbon nucleic-acid-binding protein